MSGITDSKVLIISSSFSAGNATTSLNLFNKWDNNSLYCATMSELSFQYSDKFASLPTNWFLAFSIICC